MTWRETHVPDTHTESGREDVLGSRALHSRNVLLPNDRLVRVRDDGCRMQIRQGTDPVLPCGERPGARKGRELQEPT
jgi:hypothetical protein